MAQVRKPRNESDSNASDMESMPSGSPPMPVSTQHTRFEEQLNKMLLSVRVHEAIGGAFAGVVGTALGHPLDTIKVRMQTQSKHNPLYSSAIDCFWKIFRNEGVSGLYKGLVSPMLNLTILNTMSFAVYGESKRFIANRIASDNNLKSRHYFLAGSFVGFATTVISTPFEMVKVRLQLDNITERQYKGSLSCAVDISRTHGSSLLYTGFWVNAYRETVFSMVYFGMYEILKMNFLQLSKKKLSDEAFNTYASPLSIYFAGGIAGMTAWFASFPLDVVKSIIQSQPLNNITRNTPERKRMWNATVERWHTAGIRGFYSGVVISLIRAFFVSSSRFAAFEGAVALLSRIAEKA